MREKEEATIDAGWLADDGGIGAAEIRTVIRSIREGWNTPLTKRIELAAQIERARLHPHASKRLRQAAWNFDKACREAGWLDATKKVNK